MSFVFQWTTFFCPAGKLWSWHHELFLWPEKKNNRRKQLYMDCIILVCVRLSLVKAKPDRRSSPVLHRLLSFNSLCWDLVHRSWLHIQLSRLTAYKKHLAWSCRWMCVGGYHVQAPLVVMLQDNAQTPVFSPISLLISIFFLCQFPSIRICWGQKSGRYNLYVYDISVCVHVCCC